MGNRLKVGLVIAMTAALGFGFLPLVVPDSPWSFERLHVFLFNLCSCGAVLIGFSAPAARAWRRAAVWFAVALAYALSAFFEAYPLTLALSVPLWAVVERTRQQRFGLVPWDFFSGRVRVSEKFHHAALLCLSLGVVIASLVIVNNEYLHLVRYEKLALDVFFLGYSFPISLITMSVMFHFMAPERSRLVAALEEYAFWGVNLGVILFFALIVLEVTAAQIAVASLLALTVLLVLWLFATRAPAAQQKAFLLSGLAFFVWTATTGLLYIVYHLVPALAAWKPYLLTLHATVSLYGWNLSGVLVIVRWNDFPIRLNSRRLIALHWVTVLVLAPLGKYLLPAAAVALPAYALLLALAFSARGSQEVAPP